MRYRRLAALCAGLLLAGCPKKSESEGQPAPSASVAPAPKASAASSATASATAAPTAATPGKATAYTGTYTLAPGKYYIAESKEFSGVKQAKDDPAKFVGEGALTLNVEADGAVAGTIDSGPASPAVIEGRLMGTDLRGRVRRKNASDEGLTGLLVAVVAAGGASGTLSLAESNASVVREGKLTLKRK